MKTRESSFLGEKTHWSVFDKQKIKILKENI